MWFCVDNRVKMGRMNEGMEKDCGGIAKGRKKVCGFVWLI